MSMHLTKFPELVTFLNDRNIPNAANMVEHVVELPVKLPPLEEIVHVRWEKTLPYIQLVCVMVRDVNPERINQVEIACCRANNTIVLPGFGFDYTRRAVYFRQTLMVRDGIDAQFLQQMILAVTCNARDFLVPFQRVVNHESAGERICDLAVEFARENPPPPTQG